jgi:L-alanine-DL-glutamate epimerase-like enolase superfamily enzyme
MSGRRKPFAAKHQENAPMIQTTKTNLNFEREPMAAPWGFKGGYLTEIWQAVALLEAQSGKRGIGLGSQSVLWCDPRVFTRTSEPGGNAMMLLMTEHALAEAHNHPFSTPLDLLDSLLPSTLEYGKAITGQADLRVTFALNALVAVDNAAWLLKAAEEGTTSFDSLLPEEFRPALSHRLPRVASVPAVGYGMRVEDAVGVVDAGYFVLKMKIGSAPGGDPDQDKMLAWDQHRLAEIHKAVKDLDAPGSPTGRVLYYLDANGRYDSKGRVMRLLDHAGSIGALDRVIVLEEPFAEDSHEDVSDIPVRVVADESAATLEETQERIDLGYGAIALKPVAKTLSMSLRIARLAHERGVPCFCADLTVNPVLVEWNKAVAARLAPMPGLDLGLLETNGWQNYRAWARMLTSLPDHDAPWTRARNGVYELDEEYWERSGDLFAESRHFKALVAPE